MTLTRLKAEEHFAQIKKREPVPAREVDVTAHQRADKTTRLRALRLAKEAEDAAEKQAALDIKAAGKAAFRKLRA
jgi:hypothetical protein